MFARKYVGVLVCCGALAALTGCYTPGSTPAQSSASPEEPAAVAPDSQVGDSLEAVVVSAFVEIDGLHVTATSYVAGVIEEGGRCEYVFENESDSSVVTVITTGVADRSTTACPAAVEPIESFTSGTWQVVLTYTSVHGDSVTSESLALEIA